VAGALNLILTSVQPQPPSDAPAPPPSEEAIRSRRWWRWIWIAGVSSIVGLVGLGLLAPFVLRSAKKADQTEAVNNARQIGIALMEFETEYGKFPDPSTTAEVRRKTGTVIPLGSKSSNDFFRQLLASGIAPGELAFYAKGSSVFRPDDVFTGENALAKGECGFTFFLGANSAINSHRPIVVAPMIPGTDRFDPKPFKGKAVVLTLDGTAYSLPIDKDGHVILEGRNMMDPHHPVWEGHAPVIAWQEL
jgi:type II secretory pathway pseudopilin PulG